MRLPSPLIRPLAALAIAALVAACVTEAGGTTPDPSASYLTTPRATEATASDECGALYVEGTPVPVTIQKLVSQGRALIIGTVTAIEPSMFNTSDGKRPRGFGTMQGGLSNPSAHIITPVVVLLSKDINSGLKPGSVNAYIKGGTVGCYQEKVSFAPDLAVKNRYVFVLQDGTNADGKHSKDRPEIVYAYPVDADDMVQTDQGKISVSDVIKQAESVTPAPTS